MANIGEFDPGILSYIRGRIAQGADDKTIKAEILQTDARFIPIGSDPQTADTYIVYARSTRVGVSSQISPDISRTFPCEYVRLKAKLNDGRTLSWTHWVPNKAVDDLFGIAADESYLTGEKYADEQARSYMKDGIYHLSNGDEEYITAEKINEVSTTLDTENLTVAEIVRREAHLRNPRDVTVRPRVKKPSLQQAVGALDDVLNGKATLNDFFGKLRLPQRSEAAANTLLKPTETGYATLSEGKPLDIRPLFTDDILYKIVEIRRVQVLRGIA